MAGGFVQKWTTGKSAYRTTSYHSKRRAGESAGLYLAEALAPEDCSFAFLFLPQSCRNCMFQAVSELEPAFFAGVGLEAT